MLIFRKDGQRALDCSRRDDWQRWTLKRGHPTRGFAFLQDP